MRYERIELNAADVRYNVVCNMRIGDTKAILFPRMIRWINYAHYSK